MKSAERHELATNELLEALRQWSAKVRPYVSYTLIAAVLLAVGIFVYVTKRKESRLLATEATLTLVQATRAGLTVSRGAATSEMVAKEIRELEDFLKRFPDSSLASLARLNLANRRYDRALMLWAEGKDAALVDADLAEAEKLYQDLAGRQGRLAMEAEFGLASVIAERGNREEAEKRFLDLAKAHPDTDIETRANERLDVLRNSRALVFSAEPPPEAGKPEAGTQEKAEPETAAPEPAPTGPKAEEPPAPPPESPEPKSEEKK